MQRRTVPAGFSGSAPPRSGSFVLVVGHGPELELDDRAAAQLQKLGARVRTLDLWDDFTRVVDEEAGATPRAIVIEAGDRPDLAMASLRAARREPALETTPAIIALPRQQVARVEPSSGFDDFIVVPYVPEELYARIRGLEWKRSEFLTEERLKMGALVIDRAAHEVALDGRRVVMTAKEFALLAFLATNRGRVFSREALLARVWGTRYEGGARTVDIHVRRLRAKLGDAIPLETMRGAGYKLRAHDGRSATQPGQHLTEIGGDEPDVRPVAKAVTRLAARAAGVGDRPRDAASRMRAR